MIDIQKESGKLLEQIKRDGKDEQFDRPVDPRWLRENFLNDYLGLEKDLHIVEWKGFLNQLCDNIKGGLKSSAINYEYIDRDAGQIRLADHIKITDAEELSSCYFDTEAPLDRYSGSITYGELVQRAQDYRGPKESEPGEVQ